jgi:hypothetical protein
VKAGRPGGGGAKVLEYLRSARPSQPVTAAVSLILANLVDASASNGRRARPDDADDSRVGVALNQLDAECVSASLGRPEASTTTEDDVGKAELAFRLGPGERLGRKPGPTYVVSPQGPTVWFYAPSLLRTCCANVGGYVLKLPLTRGVTGGRYWI